MSTQTDEGTIIALLERFRLQRLPAALALKDKVQGGATLDERDIEFLEQVFADARDAQSLLARHPELAKLVGQVSALYKDITEAALANEQKS